VDDFVDYEKKMNRALEERRAGEEKESNDRAIPSENTTEKPNSTSSSSVKKRRQSKLFSKEQLQLTTIPSVYPSNSSNMKEF
jgi:hypothetical protein